MKNFLNDFLAGRNQTVNALIVLSIAVLVGLGCFGSSRNKDAKPIPPAFLGEWTSQDGTRLAIRNDGTGDYISGGTKIEGGTAEVNETDKTISITFFGLGKTLKIDSPPQGDTMKLDGMTFRRKGGAGLADTTTTDNSEKTNKPARRESTTSGTKANAAKYEVPGDEEMQEMTRTALLDFNDAVQQGDFTDFHSKISKMWQNQTTPEQFNQAFGEFIRKKVDISNVATADAEFSTPPAVREDKGARKLIAEGNYDITPRPVKFVLKWIPEGREWKLFGIEVDTTGSSF